MRRSLNLVLRISAVREMSPATGKMKDGKHHGHAVEQVLPTMIIKLVEGDAQAKSFGVIHIEGRNIRVRIEQRGWLTVIISGERWKEQKDMGAMLICKKSHHYGVAERIRRIAA